MPESFFKRYADEEGVMFYLHFKDGIAVRQIEVSKKGKIRLSTAHPIEDGSQLCDQPETGCDLIPADAITRGEFEETWTTQ